MMMISHKITIRDNVKRERKSVTKKERERKKNKRNRRWGPTRERLLKDDHCLRVLYKFGF